MFTLLLFYKISKQNNSRGKGFTLSHNSREICFNLVGKAGCKEQEGSWSHCIPTQKAESKQEGPPSHDSLPPGRLCLRRGIPQPSQRVPPARDQVFNHTRLWRDFPFKPQLTYILNILTSSLCCISVSIIIKFYLNYQE